MNELHLETSPYLLQHANNPIHWKAWNANTLELAKNQNKLIIISIGYSACHWCHVMEHESFEDNEVASTMNAHFISIKIDREERPDIDDLDVLQLRQPDFYVANSYASGSQVHQLYGDSAVFNFKELNL